MYQLRENILPIVLPSMFEAENFSDHPRIYVEILFNMNMHFPQQ